MKVNNFTGQSMITIKRPAKVHYKIMILIQSTCILEREQYMKCKSYLQDLLTNFHNTEISHLEVDLVSIPHIFHVPILSIWYIDPSLELSSHTATSNT